MSRMGAFLDMVALDLPKPEKVKTRPLLVLGVARDNMLTRREIEAAARAYTRRQKSSRMSPTAACSSQAGRPWPSESWHGLAESRLSVRFI